MDTMIIMSCLFVVFRCILSEKITQIIDFIMFLHLPLISVDASLMENSVETSTVYVGTASPKVL